jgi:hypothetical protein
MPPFIRLSPAQSTGIHGWGLKLKTTLSWRDVEDNEHIDMDLLIRMQVPPKELHRLMPEIPPWVLHAGARAQHAKEMLPWGAHPIRDLNGDLSDVIALRATSKQLKTMGVRYSDLRDAGMTPETMRLMGLSFQGWVDLDMQIEDTIEHFTDAQLAKVFMMTRTNVLSCFRPQ